MPGDEHLLVRERQVVVDRVPRDGPAPQLAARPDVVCDHGPIVTAAAQEDAAAGQQRALRGAAGIDGPRGLERCRHARPRDPARARRTALECRRVVRRLDVGGRWRRRRLGRRLAGPPRGLDPGRAPPCEHHDAGRSGRDRRRVRRRTATTAPAPGRAPGRCRRGSCPGGWRTQCRARRSTECRRRRRRRPGRARSRLPPCSAGSATISGSPQAPPAGRSRRWTRSCSPPAEHMQTAWARPSGPNATPVP